MIVKEIIGKHRNGENLIKNYSSNGVYIRKIGTSEKYEEAIDFASKQYNYEETNEVIPLVEDFIRYE